MSEFLEAVRVPLINIHHSFLPAFPGAEPYARAAERGTVLARAVRRHLHDRVIVRENRTVVF
jgi:formyltetrahydrofolate deformylase